MSSVVLTILGDNRGARRAIAEARADYARASDAITGESRRASQARQRIEDQEVQEARRELRAMHQARVRDLQARQRAESAAATARQRIARQEAAAQRAAEREKTRATERESSLRTRLAQREAQDAARAEADKTKATEREERRRTRLAETEAKKRARADAKAQREAEREMGARVGRYGRVAGAIGSGVASFARGAHGEYQDARQRRAYAERELGTAVRNSGGTAAETNAARQRVAAFAAQTGMTYADVASALRTGQDRGSALEAGPGQTRAEAMEVALATIRDANAEGIDPGQLLSARGRLGQAGLTGAALQNAIRYTMRAAQRGNVEVDEIIQQGLPGATSLMTQRAAALGPGATDAARQAARLQAYQESVALQEVAASSGRNAGNSSNTLASLQNFMNTPRRQELMLTNIRNAESQINTRTPEGRARAAALHSLYEGDTAMFERDPTRRGNAMRLRAGSSPLEFAARITAATGGNANDAANILAGGGHGNAQSLLTNMRGLVSFLGSDGERVAAMMRGGGVTDRELAEHKREVENDPLSQMNKAQEAHDSALTDNTSKLKNLSDRIADWTTAHPLESQGLSTVGGIVANVLGGGAGAGVVTALLGRAAPAAAAEGGGLVAGVGAAPIAAGLSILAASALGARTAITGRTVDGREASTRERVMGGIGAFTGGAAAMGDVGAAIGRAIARELGLHPITATVSPHDAAHATSRAQSGHGG